MASRGGGAFVPPGALANHLASGRTRDLLRRMSPFARTPEEQAVEANEGTFDVPNIGRPKGARFGLHPKGGGLTTTKVTYMGPGKYSKKTGRKVA